MNGDGCSSTCKIEDIDIEVKIQKKKVVEVIKRKSIPVALPLPPILAPTGHAANKEDALKAVLEAYTASQKAK